MAGRGVYEWRPTSRATKQRDRGLRREAPSQQLCHLGGLLERHRQLPQKHGLPAPLAAGQPPPEPPVLYLRPLHQGLPNAWAMGLHILSYSVTAVHHPSPCRRDICHQQLHFQLQSELSCACDAACPARVFSAGSRPKIICAGLGMCQRKRVHERLVHVSMAWS